MSDLMLTLGVDSSGTPVRFDLARLSHLLIGGIAGSGKTWCIRSLLAQLQRLPADQLRIHELDARAADRTLDVLRGAETEMNRRLELFQEAGVHQCSQYALPLPRLLYVIDEFAPLMQHSAAELENILMQLAMQGRRAGIHLILSTQQLQPEVLTGLLRAVFPSRIAFKTTSAADSRALLDQPGAEKLRQPGDMLFCPLGEEHPLSVHCTAADTKE